MDDFIYGKNLRNSRRAQRMSQHKLSNLLDISQANYSRIERNGVVNNLQLIHEIHEILGVLPKKRIAQLVEIDHYTLAEIRKPAHEDATLKQLITVNYLGTFAILAYFLYDFALGFCSGVGMSEKAGIVVSFIAVVGIGIVLSHSVWKRRY